jgi:hypothetical protein
MMRLILSFEKDLHLHAACRQPVCVLLQFYQVARIRIKTNNVNGINIYLDKAARTSRSALSLASLLSTVEESKDESSRCERGLSSSSSSSISKEEWRESC